MARLDSVGSSKPRDSPLAPAALISLLGSEHRSRTLLASGESHGWRRNCWRRTTQMRRGPMHTGNSSSSSARPSARGERSPIVPEPKRTAALRRLPAGLLLLIGVRVCGSAVHFRTDLHRKWDIVRSMLDRTPWYDLWVCRCHPDRDVVLARPDGLRMHASVFGLDRDRPAPGIVLVHGNTPKGRKLPIYRLLSTKL